MTSKIQPPKGYIVDTRTTEQMEFQYNPQPIRDRKKNNLTKQVIPGASHPRVVPSSGGSREISFRLDFEVDGEDRSFVQNKAAFLRSLEYPSRGHNFETHSPPLCLFVFGSLYKLMVYVESVDIRFDEYFNRDDLQPWFAFIDVTLVEAPIADIQAAAVRSKGGGFRVNS